MKIAYRLLAIACFSVAGLAACGGDNTTVEPSGTEATAQTTVVHFTSKDIAALPLGEFLTFDLTRPNTVYALTFSDPAELDHVLVRQASGGEYVLSDRHPVAENVVGDAFSLKEVVIANDDGQLDGSGGGDVVCNCPCCQLVNGKLVCC